MADPRGWYFVINARQKRPWQDAGEKPLYGSIDAEPLPPEPERRSSLSVRRLAIRLRTVIRPSRKVHGALR